MTEAMGESAPVRRHHGAVRAWHWLNAATLAVMAMSGMGIFNAHPRLYWGQAGAWPEQAWLDLEGADGLAFPGWMTLPGEYNLAQARLWHFAFAWVLVAALALYGLWALGSGHARRQLLPRPADLAPARLWRDIADHARLRFPTGAAALRYGPLQRLAYASVVFVALPLMVLSGLAMAPAIDAAWPWLIDLLGGRQSARSVHFVCAGALASFVLVHLCMVALSGPLNQLRGMVTGWYRAP